MSPIYGEGTNAFLRLQEEIIKHIPDQSIFAWGLSHILLAPDKVFKTFRGNWCEADYGLLASSPDAFEDVGDVAPITPSEFAFRIGHTQDLVPPPLHCVSTPQGVRIALTTIPLPPETAEMLVNEEATYCDDCREAMARSPFRRLALLRCTDRDGHLIALPLHCPEENLEAAENVAIGVHARCVKQSWHDSTRVVRLSAAMLNEVDVAPTCAEVSLLRHWHEPIEPKARRQGFSHTATDTLLAWKRSGKAPEIRLAPNCEEELRSVGFTLAPLDSELRQPETRPAEFILTTALNMHRTTQQSPDDDQHISPPVLIELGLRYPDRYDGTLCLFLLDRLHRPSAIESAHPASPAHDGLSSGHLLHDESCPTPPTAGNPHRQSHSVDIDISSSSRTLSEAEFVLPECTVSRAAAHGASMDYVRLLRLKLERPPESAYVEGYGHLLFSIELSEPFISYPSSTRSESAATSSISAPVVHVADNSECSELPITYLVPEASSPSDHFGPPPPPRLDATHDSLQPALSATATSEQTTSRPPPEAPGPCDAEISIMPSDGPRAIYTDGTDGVPSPPHDTTQDIPETATRLRLSPRRPSYDCPRSTSGPREQLRYGRTPLRTSSI